MLYIMYSFFPTQAYRPFAVNIGDKLRQIIYYKIDLKFIPLLTTENESSIRIRSYCQIC